MSAVRKFLFNVNFDAAPAADAEPLEPRFSTAELEQARKEAFAEGQAAAQAAAQAALERSLTDALRNVAQQTTLLLQGQDEAGRRAMRSAISTAVAILRKLQPELARRKGLVEVEHVLAQCIESMREEPRILVRVHDSLLDPLRERLDEIIAATGYDGRVVILADESVAEGDGRVEWSDGGIERDTDRLWREIDAALERALSEAPPAGPTGH